MKLFVQWALSNPKDWDLVGTNVWASQQTKANPVGDVSVEGIATGDSQLNAQKGWIFAINVQGVTYDWYDHYAVQSTPDTITVSAWRDDPILFPDGQKQADVGIFRNLKFDPKAGQDNTDQSFVIYAQPDRYQYWVDRGVPSNTTLKTWAEFVLPATADTKHGIYLSDAKWEEHVNARTQKGWRE